MEASSELKKQEKSKQEKDPSVIEAFISALFASQPTTTPVSSSANRDVLFNPTAKEKDSNTETAPIPKSPASDTSVKVESTTAVTRVTSPGSSAVKREISLTDEVEAYTQLSRRRKPNLTQGDEYGERGLRDMKGFEHDDRKRYDQHIDQPRHQPYFQHGPRQSSSPPPSSKYHGKVKIVTQRLPAQNGQSASTTHMLALKPVNWSKVTAKSRMLIRNIPPMLNNWDLLDYFSPYGEIVEVVIKNHIGFIQFIEVSSCQTAVRCENGKNLKGVILRLEVCNTKPSFARGNDITKPNVHLIIWDKVPSGYIDHIRFKFEKASLPIAISSMRNRAASDEEQIIRQKAQSGFIAVLNIEMKHEQQRTVDLRLLKASGASIHFDAYESISVEDAVTLIQNTTNTDESMSKFPSHQQDPPDVSTRTSLKELPQPQRSSLDVNVLQQLDVNTLAAIYDIVHVQLEAALAQQQQTRQQQQVFYHTPQSFNPHTAPPLYQQLPQVSHNRSTGSPYAANMPSTTTQYPNGQYPHSPPHQITPAKYEPIPLSTEQLGNILSSLNSNNRH